MAFLFPLFSGTLLNSFAQLFVVITQLPATLLRELITNVVNLVFANALSAATGS